MKKLILSIAIASVFAVSANADVDHDSLPSVPASALSANAGSESSSALPESTAHTTVANLTPRVNEIIPISTGHPNRFTTPFENPRIRTTSSAQIEVSGRDMYISSRDEGRPIALFIHDRDNRDLTLSVTLVPQRIPPVDMELKINQDFLMGASGSNMLVVPDRAKAWEESSPYVDALRNLMREVASGSTPSGYALSSAQFSPTIPSCYQNGLHFDFANGQIMDGNRLQIAVGVIENVSNEVIEFREPACASDDVRAVAAWPNPLLAPGQKSEVFVIRSVHQPNSVNRNARPSLIN